MLHTKVGLCGGDVNFCYVENYQQNDVQIDIKCGNIRSSHLRCSIKITS